MTRLSDAQLGAINPGVRTPAYDRAAIETGIVHFGPGAFHRAHQAVFTDDAMALSGGDWGICAVSLNSPRARSALAPQDGLYTVAIRDTQRSFRVIGSVKRVLFAGEDQQDVIHALVAPTTKFLTLTITEEGYALDGAGKLDQSNPMVQADLADPERPTSAMGYIVLATKRRLRAGLTPLTVMSCDNLPNNGDRLRSACTELAEAMGADAELLGALRRDMRFPNTMVDSITPATDPLVLIEVENALGLRDEGAVQREAFAQWVIEDDLPDDRPDWERAGAIITKDVHAFETTKLRILNGAHSTLSYLGLLAGKTSVGGAVSTPELRNFVDAMIREETIPTIRAPDDIDLDDYWAATLARFGNTDIEHRLEQISHDGSQKIPARILPVIAHHGANAQRAMFVVAAWIDWTRQRRGTDHPPTDGWLLRNRGALASPDLAPRDYAGAMLEERSVFEEDLLAKDGVKDAIIAAAQTIAERGVIAAAGEL